MYPGGVEMKRNSVKSLRLGYKRISQDAYGFLAEYLSREDATQFLPLGRPYTPDEVRGFIGAREEHWQRYGFGLFMLYPRSQDSCIGYCGLEYVADTRYVDLRYGIIVKHWGKGFATEAAKTCLRHGFEHLGLAVVYGAVVPENITSMAVLKKAGMRETDTVDFYGDGVRYFMITAEQMAENDEFLSRS